jgi:hypothetical protein
MNNKAFIAVVLLTISLTSTGVYAYNDVLSMQDSNIMISNSSITITNSTVTISNSTIILAEGNTVIYPSQTPNPSLSGTTAPKITSVSPISSSPNQTITITGSGFGNLQPQLLSLDDGSVDTVWGASTPSIVVYDKTNLLSAGAAGDWSGFTNGPPDLIGITLVSWSDTQIILGGFGSGLNSRFAWNQVMQGDTIEIQVQTTGGLTTFNTVIN